MNDLTWPEKLRAAVSEIVGSETADHVVGDCGNLPDETSKATWAGQAIRRLEVAVPDESTRWEIMSRCSCTCADDLIAEHRDSFRNHRDLHRLLEEMYQKPFFVRPELDGNSIKLTKVACNREAFDQATTDADRRIAYCHCEFARGSKGDIPETHCYCGGGWYKRIFEGILERKVEMRLLKSVMRGDDICQFAVIVPPDCTE